MQIMPQNAASVQHSATKFTISLRKGCVYGRFFACFPAYILKYLAEKRAVHFLYYRGGRRRENER